MFFCKIQNKDARSTIVVGIGYDKGLENIKIQDLILYNNIQSVKKLSGFISTMIEIERGVRQGCPLSALLYILIAEVLGIEVRLNDKIVGYKFRDQEHKIL